MSFRVQISAQRDLGEQFQIFGNRPFEIIIPSRLPETSGLELERWRGLTHQCVSDLGNERLLYRGNLTKLESLGHFGHLLPGSFQRLRDYGKTTAGREDFSTTMA